MDELGRIAGALTPDEAAEFTLHQDAHGHISFAHKLPVFTAIKQIDAKIRALRYEEFSVDIDVAALAPGTVSIRVREEVCDRHPEAGFISAIHEGHGLPAELLPRSKVYPGRKHLTLPVDWTPVGKMVDYIKVEEKFLKENVRDATRFQSWQNLQNRIKIPDLRHFFAKNFYLSSLGISKKMF